MRTWFRLVAGAPLLAAAIAGPLSRPVSAQCDPQEAYNQCQAYAQDCANACVASCASQGRWPDPHPSCNFDGEGCFTGGSCFCHCFGPY